MHHYSGEVQQRSAERRRPVSYRLVALIVALGLVAAACTSQVDGHPVSDGAADSTNSSAPGEQGGGRSDNVVLVDAPPAPADTSGIALQDVWMFAGIRGVAADGSSEHLLQQVVDSLKPLASEPVALTPSLQFAPVNDVYAVFANEFGEVRSEIPVSIGLFSLSGEFDGVADGDATLGVITSAPDGITNVSGGDELVIDTGTIPALERYPTVVVDYVFGQAEPSSGANYVSNDPLDVLAGRFAAESVSFTGMDVDGEMEVGLRRGVVGQAESPASQSVREAGTALRSAGSAGSAGSAFESNRVSGRFLADPGTLLGGLLGIPIKEGMIGWPTVGLTIFCIAGGILLPPPANVIFAVFCVALDVVGTVSSIGNAIEKNNGNKSGNGGGSSGGDPHLTTFDGARRDLMAVGEFDMVVADGMRVQARTGPWGSSKRISVNTAVAADVLGDVVVIDALAGAPIDITVNAEPFELSQAQTLELPAGGTVVRIGNAIAVNWPDRSSALVSLRNSSLELQVSPGDNAPSVAGLFGDADNDPANDFFARSGARPAELTDEAFYGEVVESWRVDDDSNLFGSPLTHDPAFPEPGDPLADIDEGVLAWAQLICEATGLTGADFDNCVLDVAVTGDVRHSQAAAANQAMQAPGTFDFTAADARRAPHQQWRMFPEQSHIDRRTLADEAGNIVFGSRIGSVGQLATLRASDLSTIAATQFAYKCGFTLSRGATIIAQVASDDRPQVALGASDPSLSPSGKSMYDDPQIVTLPGSAKHCQAIMTNDADPNAALLGLAADGKDPLLFWAGAAEVARGAAGGGADIAFDELAVPGLVAGPVVADDGGVWVVTKVHEQLRAARLDTKAGALTAEMTLPGTDVVRDIVATEDGILAPTKGDGDHLVRITAAGEIWRTEFPLSIDDRSYSLPSRLSVDKQSVAGYANSDDIVVLDAVTGTKSGTFRATSFNNNGGEIAHYDGNIVVAPFGGKHWVEAYDPVDFTLAWAVQAPAGSGANDAKRIDVLSGSALLVQATGKIGSETGAIISRVAFG